MRNKISLLFLLVSHNCYLFGQQKTNENLNHIIQEDLRLIDASFSDKIFMEKSDGNYSNYSTIVNVDTVFNDFYKDSYVKLLKVEWLLTQPIILKGKLMRQNDTMSVYILNYHNQNFKLFGFRYSNLLFCDLANDNKFIVWFGRKLAQKNLLNRKENRLWQKSLRKSDKYSQRINKPCVILNFFEDVLGKKHIQTYISQRIEELSI